MSEIEGWMVPQSERQASERRENELRAAIRAALEAAVERCGTTCILHECGSLFPLFAASIRSLSPDDILKRL